VDNEDLRLFRTRNRWISLATIVTASLLLVPSIVPISHAYGQAQWQVAFSGGFTNPTAHTSNGFWGWCDFAGSAADGKSGTDADCQVTTYFFAGQGASTGNLLHQSIHGTAWSMQPSTFPPVPGLPPIDFFITDGTMTITGPFVVKFISQLPGPPPSGCMLSGQSATCPLAFWESVHLYSPDTGVPAQAGHYSLSNLLEAVGVELPPGTHINVQVSQIP
jgi:hypothetical protein